MPEISESRPNPKISRRQFLKFTGLVGGAAFLGGLLEGPEIAEYSLRNPEVLDKTLSLIEQYYIDCGVAVTKSVTQKIPIPNPDKRPIVDIIREGVALYGKQVRYKFNQKRKPDQFWEERMHKMATEINAIDLIKIAAGDFAAGAKVQNAYNKILYDRDLMAEAGTKNLVISAGIFDSLNDIAKVENSSFYNLTDEAVRNKIQEAKLFVEQKAANGPISASTILAYFLEGSSGDLSTAIEDTAIFLKIYARNNLETGEWLGEYDSNKPEKIKRYTAIRDEYLPRGTHFMEDVTQGTKYEQFDLDTNNLIGAAYHAWNAVATLRILPPRTTAKASVMRVLHAANNNQGNFKVASITSVARQLNNLEGYFASLA